MRRNTAIASAAVAVLAGTGLWFASTLHDDEIARLQQRNAELETAAARLAAELEEARDEARQLKGALAAAGREAKTAPSSAGSPAFVPGLGAAPSDSGAASGATGPHVATFGASGLPAAGQQVAVTGPGPGMQRKVDSTDRWEAARQRDLARYSATALAEANQLFDEGQRAIRAPEGQAKLKELIERYPQSNRAGCAAANLAGVLAEQGRLDEARALLEPLVRDGTEAVYASGERVQVKALYDYGVLLSRTGDTSGAREQFQRIVDQYPTELDSRGTPYADLARERLR